MAIRGTLQEAGLPDVIQMLHLGRRSGCLALADRGRHASVFFSDGWIIDAKIVNRPDRIGDLLVNAGSVSAEQLAEAVQRQTKHPGQRIGEILVGQGVLSAKDLQKMLQRQVEEAIYSLFNWRGGSFTFEAGLETEVGAEQVRISPDRLLLEGARRVDEWAVIQKKVPEFDLIFAVDPAHREATGLGYTEVQRRLHPLLDGRRDVRDLVEESGLTEFEVCQALYALLSAGIIHRVGTSTPGPSARSRETQIEEHRNLGVAFYRTGMLEEASREFRRVMELRPSEGSAPFHLGLIAARESRWADAAYFFEVASDRGGPRAAILHNLGVALAKVGEWEQAESVLSEAAGRAPSDARIQLSWALLALDCGEPAVALARLTRGKELAGEEVPACWSWAATRAYASQGDLERALEVSRAAVTLHPEHPILLNNHCVLLEAAGDLAEAEAGLNRALDLEPGFAQISKNLGDVLYRLGRFDEAWTSYSRAESLNPDLGEDLHFRMGNLALRRGDTAAARAHWGRALQLHPGHQLARANLQALGS
jgi:Flp pilus assembly protein TadD